MNKDETVLGIATYQINDWQELLKISDDRANLEETWDEWNDNIHKYEEHLRKNNKTFKEILINLEELKIFCKNNELLINGESRSHFVSEKLLELNLRQ